MKTLARHLAVAVATVVPSIAQAAPCPPTAGACNVLVDNGTSGARLDVAVLGDGYTAAEQAKFFSDATTLSTALFAEGPYGSYKQLFNAFALYTPSAQSGADDPATGTMVDTAFDASYGTSGIPYLLAVDDGKALMEVANRCPECDLVVVLVNATPYGGSGGAVAVVSLDQASAEIMRHEIGHTLANLADEYSDPYPGFPEGDPEPNVAAIHHLNPLKWAPWVTPGTPIPTPIASATGDLTPLGAYEGARYQPENMFRPTPTCIMRELGKPFCPVCDEAMVLSISELSSTIELPTPATVPSVAPLAATTLFSATLPALPNLAVSWSLDGVDQNVQVPAFSLQPSSAGLSVGLHTLVLTVKDQTPLVRSDPTNILVESYTWHVAVTLVDCAVEIDGTSCDDGSACTSADTCMGGTCVGTPPPPCPAPQPCELAGSCDFVTGSCVFPPKVCPDAASCKLPGVCNPANGQCSYANAPDQSACDDQSECTHGDFCLAGKCKAGTEVTQCAGEPCFKPKCDTFNGLCMLLPLADGKPCDDGNLCTLSETCSSQRCIPESTVDCPAPDECHDPGACDPATGACSDVAKANDTLCTDGSCQDGVCTPLPKKPPKPTPDDGCGCRIAPAESPSWTILGLAFLGAAARRRRRFVRAGAAPRSRS